MLWTSFQEGICSAQEKIEKELTPYGCSVTNANISELRDTPGEDNKYFETLKTKAISAATQEARSVYLVTRCFATCVGQSRLEHARKLMPCFPLCNSTHHVRFKTSMSTRLAC